MCNHNKVTVFSKVLYPATRYERAVLAEYGECDECGERFEDVTDIPEESDVEVENV